MLCGCSHIPEMRHHCQQTGRAMCCPFRRVGVAAASSQCRNMNVRSPSVGSFHEYFVSWENQGEEKVIGLLIYFSFNCVGATLFMKHNHELTKISSFCGCFTVPCCSHINNEPVDCEPHFQGSFWLVAVVRIPVE